MTRKLVFRPQVESDIVAAASWYDEQRPGLGWKFVQAMDRLIGRVAEAPLRYQVIEDDVRRAIHHRFPYGAFYYCDDSTVVVLSVVHLHRRPGLWRSRR